MKQYRYRLKYGQWHIEIHAKKPVRVEGPMSWADCERRLGELDALGYVDLDKVNL